MMPVNGRSSHICDDNNRRQKQTNKFVNLAILYNVLNTINFNNEATGINSSHRANNFLNG